MTMCSYLRHKYTYPEVSQKGKKQKQDQDY